MSIFPDIIKILFLDKDSNKQISNIAAKIKVFANHKNDYNFILPLSDEMGYIKITKDWLMEEIEKEQELFVMDYSSILEDCEPLIEISVLDIEALSRAVNAMYLFQDATGISDDDIAKYKNADNSKYVPCTINSKLEGAKSLDIDILLKLRAWNSVTIRNQDRSKLGFKKEVSIYIDFIKDYDFKCITEEETQVSFEADKVLIYSNKHIIVILEFLFLLI